MIEEGEHCWKAADNVVLTAQFATEGKVGDFGLFYKILAINTVTAILVILFVILYVRKKLEYESSHDPLTGLFNRRSYGKMIQSEALYRVKNKGRNRTEICIPEEDYQ
ncbi:MAG: hypothetical protein KAR40_13190 [Candidatus Sabulitectum sp.]|nr:hypothetical protein [Candidatus Sabulitectum sp.]